MGKKTGKSKCCFCLKYALKVTYEHLEHKKIFGVIPRTPIKQGRGGKGGKGQKEWKGREGREDVGHHHYLAQSYAIG
jgi:hypothetical protein